MDPYRTTTIPADHFAVHDWPVGLNVVMPWFRPTVGIALGNGVGELDATAAFEVYGQSSAARTISLAPGDTVRTRHGLVLLTTSYSHAPGLSRVVVPGTPQPQRHRPSPAIPWGQGPAGLDPRIPSQAGFTAALQDLADHTNAATTSATAKMFGYPTTDLHLGNAHGSWRTILLAIAALLLAVLVGLTPVFLVRRRRRRGNQAGSLPIASSANDSEAAPHGASVRHETRATTAPVGRRRRASRSTESEMTLV